MVSALSARRFIPWTAAAISVFIFASLIGPGRAQSSVRPVPPGGPAGAAGLGAVAPPRATPGSPLPHRSGRVAVDRRRSLRPAGAQAPGAAGARRAGAGGAAAAGTPGTAAAGTAAAGTAAAATAAASTARVALRALVIGVDTDDWGVATWRATLDRVGAGYDVLYSRTTALTAGDLVRPDGVGAYNAILLTSSMQLYSDGAGGYASGLDAGEWNTLWAYERDFAVRQAVLYTSYGTWPEDYCLSASTEGGVGDTPLPASLTATGAGVFDYLRSTATVAITQSYVYRTRVTAGCSGQAVLVNGADVLGVRSTSTDGRERLALSFTSNQYLMQSNLLVYGLFRWASRGLFLGEQRHYLEVDIDDWFNSSDERLPDGTLNSVPGYQMSGHDAYNLDQRLAALRGQYPQSSAFRVSLAFNAGEAAAGAGSGCSPNGGVGTLTATSRCLAGHFRWINHTANHTELNFTDYATTSSQISTNLSLAATLGLSAPAQVLKTPSYSGLGVYNPDPNDNVNPPTDHGLGATNPNLLAAADALGVRYVHGNMSFPSEVPACFDCGITHPLDPNLTVVPDWPTNIWYFSTTPDEETSFYNAYYGPGGLFPYWPQNLTYAQVMAYESDVALGHLATGSIYTHTFHIGNARDYGGGNTLVTDWVAAVLAKFQAAYSVPLLSPAWPDLAGYAKARIGHFAALSGGAGAVYDPVAGTVTVSSPVAGTVTVSGARATGFTGYGSEVSAPVTLAAGGSVTAPASLLP
jgi:hypothetical protein